jgi:hypothetical protein
MRLGVWPSHCRWYRDGLDGHAEGGQGKRKMGLGLELDGGMAVRKVCCVAGGREEERRRRPMP